MKHLVKFKMENGGTVVFEVDEPETGGTTRVSRLPGGRIVEETKDTFEQALSRICSSTEKVIHTLSQLVQKPDEIEMEFGFKMSGEVGAVIASINGEGNYKVTLRWKDEEKKAG